MPVAVRNLKTGPTVFSILEGENKIQVEWKGKGDPYGEDVQEVPDSLLEDTRFRRALTRGVLERVDREEADGFIARQSQGAREREDAAAQAAVQAIDPAANNDLVSLPCQGPNERGTGECGAPVPTREKDKGDAPVLCSQHESLAFQFVQVPTGQMVDKGDSLVPEQHWVRSVLGERERQV